MRPVQKYTSFPRGGQIILLLKNRGDWERVKLRDPVETNNPTETEREEEGERQTKIEDKG